MAVAAAAAPTAAAAARKLLGRFVGTTPVTLFRVQGGANVRLRREATQKTLGRRGFDVAASPEGVVLPRVAAGADEHFLGPNGMSARPKCAILAINFFGHSTGGNKRTLVFEVPAGTVIPPELVVLQEEPDLYSFEPAVPMTPTKLNAALTAFLAGPTIVKMEGKDAFYSRHPDMHPNVVGFSRNG